MAREKKFVMEKGYYEILEISPSSTTTEIQRSFERLCDENVNLNDDDITVRKQSAEILFALTKAYEILTDPFQRLSYDERRFGGKQPVNNEVETIFKEGLRSFRSNSMDNSIRFLKESVYLHPHRVTYRVNLAISYFEKGWREYAENELRMALKLDPENDFAQEVVARLLFKVSDRKTINFFAHKVNRQMAAIVAGLVLTSGILAVGVPRALASFDRSKAKKEQVEMNDKIVELHSQLPSDLKGTTNNPTPENNTNKPKASSNKLSKLADEFVPSGQLYDYTDQKAIKKSYYASQNMVVVNYDNGSILSYKLSDVVGWKTDPKTKLPVILTKGNEIIPVPGDVPVTLENGMSVLPGEEGFPSTAFPEYGNVSKKTDVVSADPNKGKEDKPKAVEGLPPIGDHPGN